MQVFVDAVWYCRLLCSKKEDKKQKWKCDDDTTTTNDLPPMVPNDEMKIMIEIQLLTLVACGINITQIKFAGDRVGAAMGMKENHGITGLNSWTIESQLTSYMPEECGIYLVKHTARYFHQFGMLGEAVLDEVDQVSKSSTSGAAYRPKQTKPDLEFMDSMGIFVYEELFLLNLFYQPSGRDILEKAFNAIKGKAPLQQLLAGTSTFEDLSNNPMVKYGSFDDKREVNSKSVKRVLNPLLGVDIVPKTKRMLKSAAAVVLNDLMPQPRILGNQRVRAKNLGLECWVDVDDDRKELWNVVYGNLKSNLSNNRSASSLFHSNYFASDSQPVLNFYRPNVELKNHFIEVCPTKITLQLMDSNGNIINQNLKPPGKVFNADDSIESGKVNLTKFRVKKKEYAAGAFIQIFGFKLPLGDLGLKKFTLKKPLRYYLPNEKKNIHNIH
jgi:hypothetical protein